MSSSDDTQKKRAADEPRTGVLRESHSTNKRPRSDDSDASFIDYHWIDNGTVDEYETKRIHNGIRISTQAGSFDVRPGDCVALWSSDEAAESQQWEAQWICRVEELWEPLNSDPSSSPDQIILFRGRWMYSRRELVKCRGRWRGVMTQEKLLSSLAPNELVLSDQEDKNPVAAIQSKVQVLFQQPLAGPTPTTAQYLCRYALTLEGRVCTLSVLNDSQSLSMNLGGDSLSSDDMADDDSGSEARERRRVPFPEGEGSNLRAEIQVGEAHQITVGPFIAGQVVASRKPKKVWEPNRISDDQLRTFLDRLSAIHNEYLTRNKISSEEPYSPLSTEKAELEMLRIAKAQGISTIPMLTGSNVSTASRLTVTPNAMWKECDVDAVMELLNDHGYDTEAALEAARKNLDSITNGWSYAEKTLFDDGFRHANGSLRRIANNVDTKTNKEVVDFWFRFKIPDQFRLYQNKKREQSIRIMECIEKRRYLDLTMRSTTGDASRQQENVFQAPNTKPSKWSEASVGEVTGAVEQRRHLAKQLLLDVQDTLGPEVTSRVAAALRRLHKSYSHSVKEELFALLENQPELKKRFLEFLPKAW